MLNYRHTSTYAWHVPYVITKESRLSHTWDIVSLLCQLYELTISPMRMTPARSATIDTISSSSNPTLSILLTTDSNAALHWGETTITNLVLTSLMSAKININLTDNNYSRKLEVGNFV